MIITDGGQQKEVVPSAQTTGAFGTTPSPAIQGQAGTGYSLQITPTGQAILSLKEPMFVEGTFYEQGTRLLFASDVAARNWMWQPSTIAYGVPQRVIARLQELNAAPQTGKGGGKPTAATIAAMQSVEEGTGPYAAPRPQPLAIIVTQTPSPKSPGPSVTPVVASAVSSAAPATASKPYMPSLEKNLDIFAVEAQQDASREFWSSDYGQFLLSNAGAMRVFESALAAGRVAPTFIITQQIASEVPTVKPSKQEAYQQYHDVRMPELLQAESETFYKNIGYPQYGGKYGTFEVPAGYKIENITEQGGNLSVSFAALPAVSGVKLKGSLGLAVNVGLPFVQNVAASIVKPFYEEADIIKYNLAHPVEALAPNLPTYPVTLEEKKILQERTDISVIGLSTAAVLVAPPLIPLKLAGSVALGVGARTLVASGIGAASGYYFGGVQGAEIGALTGGLFYLGSYGLSKVAQSVVQKSLQKSYEASLQSGELWKPSVLEKVGMAATGAKPKPLAPSVVELPTLIQEGPAGIEPTNILDVRGLQATLGLGSEEMKQLPSLIASEDILDLTMAPRTAGFGLTEPLAVNVAKQAATSALPLTDIEGMGVGLSSITAKWFLPGSNEPIPQDALGFTKEPQTYRAAQTQYFNEAKGVLQDSTLSFSKEFGELPTKSGLLSQITEQEAKAILPSSGMKNVFGSALETVQKSVTVPIVPASLGDLTGWLVKQETQVKIPQASAIAPALFNVQLQGQVRELDETQYLSFPGQLLTVNVPKRETRQTVSPLLNLGDMNASIDKQDFGAVESLPVLEKQAYTFAKPQTSTLLKPLTSPLTSNILEEKTRSAIIPNISLSEALVPASALDVPQLQMPKLDVPQLQIPKLVVPTPTVPTVPTPGKLGFPFPLGGGGGGGGGGSDFIFPRGRGAHRYIWEFPVKNPSVLWNLMTTGQKRSSKKHK